MCSDSLKCKQSQRFLVVDDDATSRELARIYLGLIGIDDVHEASDGAQALRLLDTMHPPVDCLVCDIYMPRRDGIELISELATRGYQGGLVLMSGGDLQMLAIAKQIAQQSGLDVWAALAKPLQLETLRQVFA